MDDCVDARVWGVWVNTPSVGLIVNVTGCAWTVRQQLHWKKKKKTEIDMNRETDS